MKQLLDISGRYIAGGWCDRAFAGCLDSSQVYELGPHNATHQPSDGSAADHGQAREIQAISISRLDTGIVWCAVAWYDKTLCLYDMERCLDCTPDSNINHVSLIEPCATYKTAKRVTSLCFATVKDADETAKFLNVVIAADLAGDAVAFALERFENDPRRDDISDQHGDVSASHTPYRRLLLGHTATMLTCVRVGQDSLQNQRIFTADRDEKIRISSFPATSIIEGFLLGHEAFVSCIDVSRGQKPRCVSCSGDGSVRMWDYLSKEELGKHGFGNERGDNKVSLLTKVAMNAQCDTVLVCADEEEMVQVLRWKDEQRCFEPIPVDVRVGSVLAANWIDDETFLTLATGPRCVMAHRLLREGEVSQVELPLIKALNELAVDEKIVLPRSILERDEFGILKMKKQEERRVQNRDRVWNDAARIDVAKERDRRYKKRKKDRDASAATGEDDASSDTEL